MWLASSSTVVNVGLVVEVADRMTIGSGDETGRGQTVSWRRAVRALDVLVVHCVCV